MDTFSKNFKEWMDSNHLKAGDVATALHVEAQTVRNWRASGIPLRSQARVAEWMATLNREKAGDPANELQGQTLLLFPSPTEFQAWGLAALASGKLIPDWAKDGLNHLARHRGYGDATDLVVPTDGLSVVPRAAEPPGPAYAGCGECDDETC